MSYQQEQLLHKNVGNNAFSYDERKERFGEAEIVIPPLKQIERIEQVERSEQIVFEEIDDKGELHSIRGLKHLYHLQNEAIPNDVYIVDNHNHALYFWLQKLADSSPPDADEAPTKEVSFPHVQLLHIDQHSDLNRPDQSLDIAMISDQNYLRQYVNFATNIGNFIRPLLDQRPSIDFQRIKSETELLEFGSDRPSSLQPPIRILDIDLDFRAPEMAGGNTSRTIQHVRSVLHDADLTTIATSPYFLDQSHALKLLGEILGD